MTDYAPAFPEQDKAFRILANPWLNVHSGGRPVDTHSPVVLCSVGEQHARPLSQGRLKRLRSGDKQKDGERATLERAARHSQQGEGGGY